MRVKTSCSRINRHVTVDDASPIERQVPHILATRNHEELAMGAIATGGMRVLELVGKQ